jgi:hypothetical protein
MRQGEVPILGAALNEGLRGVADDGNRRGDAEHDLRGEVRALISRQQEARVGQREQHVHQGEPDQPIEHAWRAVRG